MSLENEGIALLHDIPDMLPVSREHFECWNIKVIQRKPNTCKNYLSPNRREFYKILYNTKGAGVFTLGKNTYYIDEPTILFVHPSEIISWKKLDKNAEGYICLFKRKYVDEHPALKAIIEKYTLFSDSRKSVIRLKTEDISVLDNLFAQMYIEDTNSGPIAEDMMQAYLQLLIVTSTKAADYPVPDAITGEFKHVHEFFHLLEKEVASINNVNPIRIKTAKEFADHLSLHPNYLNALLKKHTGQNVSTHIKDRLLEESKVLLLKTDWNLQRIGFAVGFAEQPNFSQFFKKNIGITPAEFRKTNSL